MATILWIMMLLFTLVSSDSLPSSIEVKRKYNFTDQEIETKRSNGMLVEFKKFIRELSKEKREKQSLAFLCAQMLGRHSNTLIFNKIYTDHKVLNEYFMVKDNNPVCHPLIVNDNVRDKGVQERKNRHKWFRSIWLNTTRYGRVLRTHITAVFFGHPDPIVGSNLFALCACTYAKQERIANIYAHVVNKFVTILRSTKDEDFSIAAKKLLDENKMTVDEILLTEDEFKCYYALILTATGEKLDSIPYKEDEKYVIPQVNPESCKVPYNFNLF